MSYDIHIEDKSGNIITLDHNHHLTGGTYQLGGNNTLEFNITYNYAKFYYDFLDKKLGIRWLYGKNVGKTLSKLSLAADKIFNTKNKKYNKLLGKGKPDMHYNNSLFSTTCTPWKEDDYWAPMAKNAATALYNLIALGIMAPEGFWNGD